MRTIKELKKHLTEVGYELEAITKIYKFLREKNISIFPLKIGEKTYNDFLNWFEKDLHIYPPFFLDDIKFKEFVSSITSVEQKKDSEFLIDLLDTIFCSMNTETMKGKEEDILVKEQKEILKAWEEALSALSLLKHPKNKYLKELISNCLISYEKEMNELDEKINATED